MGHNSNRTLLAGALLAVLLMVGAVPAHAVEFARTLRAGDSGDDVAELQMRIAGWFPRDDQRRFRLSGTFDGRTSKALMAFQEHYGLEPSGEATDEVYAILESLEDDDGSTEHFDFDEFDQNYNPKCSDAANKRAGTFKGGLVGNKQVRTYVTRLMWRLEALRAKVGDRPITITSGFRSVAYNDCIGGAGLSQHLFGAGADLVVSGLDNHDARVTARGTQFHGIACYSATSHNHLDVRLDNADLPEAWYWYWPEQDDKGRDIADDGKLCKGEKKQEASMLRALRGAATDPVATLERYFEATGHEEFYGGLAD